MDALLILAALAFILFLYKALMFGNFKSELMHALAKEGVSYSAGDALYTKHAKLVAKMHANGLSPADIAIGLVNSTIKTIDDLPFSAIREIYDLTGNLTDSLRGGDLSPTKNFFVITDFNIEIASFLSYIKLHYGVGVEVPSGGSRFMSGLETNDVDAMIDIRNVIGAICDLSSSDANDFCFRFFWPQMHHKLMTEKVG